MNTTTPLKEEPRSAKPVQTSPKADEPAPLLIDTSKMSAGQTAALELTEAARDASAERASLGEGLFMGSVRWADLVPFPEQPEADQEAGQPFLRQLGRFLADKVDPEAIDRTGEIPREVMEELAEMGAFGIKIGKEYGGLGLSQTNYCRAAMELGARCGNLTALISAHQSIGVPQPLLMFGTEEQKRRYLPRVAAGEISAFALTEAGVGSDPATLQTRADPTPDGSHFILNGEKLWCTNGTKAGILVVMAKTPSQVVRGKERNQITAFIVEADSPGVEIVRRCHFMGLKALYNGVIRFTNVKVPRENILLSEGKGLRVALATLNTGRLTLPAACVGASRECLRIVREWCNERIQWGSSIGKHAAIAEKVARMASHVFAMESMTLYTAGLVDRDHKADIRIEAAMCKLWGTEMAWEIVNDTMQIRGGRGFETADSLAARGEKPVGVERMFRDCRINTIFEGSSEIMRLLIAREALNPHLKVAGAVLNSQLPADVRVKAGVKAASFYATWYPQQWQPFTDHLGLRGVEHPMLRRSLRKVAGLSRKLARTLFHAMVVHGPRLEREQVLLGRFVDIGTELFAMAASCARADALIRKGGDSAELIPLVDYFCKMSLQRVRRRFEGVRRNADREGYRLAQRILKGSTAAG